VQAVDAAIGRCVQLETENEHLRLHVAQLSNHITSSAGPGGNHSPRGGHVGAMPGGSRSTSRENLLLAEAAAATSPREASPLSQSRRGSLSSDPRLDTMAARSSYSAAAAAAPPAPTVITPGQTSAVGLYRV
jgi:hypothetical protein